MASAVEIGIANVERGCCVRVTKDVKFAKLCSTRDKGVGIPTEFAATPPLALHTKVSLIVAYQY